MFITDQFFYRLSSIRKFLSDQKLLNLAIGVYLGTVLQKFLEDVISEIIYPLSQIILPERIYKHANIKFYNQNINIAKIIKSFISFVIAIIVCYYFVTMMKA